MATYTPWGWSNNSTKLVTGVIFYSTPSHGGIHLSPKRVKKFYKLFPDFKTWCGKIEWFEEDSDICFVILAFYDDLKNNETIKGVDKTAKNLYCSEKFEKYKKQYLKAGGRAFNHENTGARL